MEMDIEKICRTCLGLSGPLLSIYDGASGGGGCIADMLRDFTKTRQCREDNMPEKVCLSCISEINRCYSFKLKCENSSRTLRQLLPNALPEEADDQYIKATVVQAHKCVQTVPFRVNRLTTVYTQTDIHGSEIARTHQHVQTTPMRDTMCDQCTLPSAMEQVKKLKQDSHKVEVSLVEKKDATNGLTESSQTPRRSNLRHAVTIKRRRVESFDQAEAEEADDTEIIMELHTDEPEMGEAASEAALYTTLHQVQPNGDTTTYYQLSNTPYEYEQNNERTTDDHNLKDANPLSEDEVECKDALYTNIIYSDDGDAFNATDVNTQAADYNFTIYKNESGEAEIVPRHTKLLTRPTSGAKISKSNNVKQELKCAHCSMTFVSSKRLERHELKRHRGSDIPKVDSANEKQVTPQTKSGTQERNIKNVVKDKRNSTSNLTSIDPANMTVQSTITITATPQPIVQTTKPSKLTYFCGSCNAGFAMRRSLIYHRKQALCNRVAYNCDKCDRAFISEKTLKEHKETHLQDHECTECGMLYETNDKLSQHMVDVHKRKLSNQCPICKKVFTILSALKDHLRVHSGEKPFVCSICSKAFSQKANLKQHTMRHSKEKKFKCEECSMRFVTKGELFSHRRTHTGEHPYQCDECKATFTMSSSLVKHKRIHTGERPYACDLCPMRFTSSFTLKNHRRTHTGEKPFKCRWCSKTFTQKQDCIIHHRTHTGERNHVCYCGEKFTHLGTLRTHMDTHDKGNDTTSVARRGKRRATQSKNATNKSEEGNITILNIGTDEDEGDADDETVTVVTVAQADMERLVANVTTQRIEEANVSEDKLIEMTIDEV